MPSDNARSAAELAAYNAFDARALARTEYNAALAELAAAPSDAARAALLVAARSVYAATCDAVRDACAAIDAIDADGAQIGLTNDQAAEIIYAVG